MRVRPLHMRVQGLGMLIVGTKSVRTSVSGRHLHLHIPPPCLVLGGSRLRHLSGHLNQAGGGSFVDSWLNPPLLNGEGLLVKSLYMERVMDFGSGFGFWTRSELGSDRPRWKAHTHNLRRGGLSHGLSLPSDVLLSRNGSIIDEVHGSGPAEFWKKGCPRATMLASLEGWDIHRFTPCFSKKRQRQRLIERPRRPKKPIGPVSRLVHFATLSAQEYNTTDMPNLALLHRLWCFRRRVIHLSWLVKAEMDRPSSTCVGSGQ